MIISNSWIRLVFAAALLMGNIACSDSGGTASPTAPAESVMVLQTASVSVNGQNVTNSSWNPSSDPAQSTRFEARLLRNGMPAIGEMVYVTFDRPQGMGSMMGMNRQGRFALYDDGTHGDPTPGDGIYCFEDFTMDYGFHHSDCPYGEYRYEYFGQDHQGHESNHMRVTIQVGH